jgi:nifR3 family TIM-barrel protein
VQAVAPLPVTAKIRIGWDADSINAPRVARILEDCGIASLAVHGRTRAQGYSGEADWRVIGEVAQAIALPVIGNGDLSSPEDVARRRRETNISGVMIGRAAMSAPWIFRQIKHYLATDELLPAPELSERWQVIIDHCRNHVENWGAEEPAIRSLRARLMAYSKNLPEAKSLREKFQHVAMLADVEQIAEQHLTKNQSRNGCLQTADNGIVGQAFLPAVPAAAS